MKPVIYIHTNRKQLISAKVGAHSLRSRSKFGRDLDIRLLILEDFPHLHKRHGKQFHWCLDEKPITYSVHDAAAFNALRRIVPQEMGFKGRALVLDPDIFAIGDVGELLSTDMDGKAILCTKRTDNDGRLWHSTAVMLLDCAKLTHWRWNEDVDALFAGKAALRSWMSLELEPEETIGVLSEEWNHLDTLNEHTKLLHNSEVCTQPWKTDLPADYFDFVDRDFGLRKLVRRIKSFVFRTPPPVKARYRRHPDIKQEQHFFGLLRECVEQGVISRAELKNAIRAGHLRADALQRLDEQ